MDRGLSADDGGGTARGGLDLLVGVAEGQIEHRRQPFADGRSCPCPSSRRASPCDPEDLHTSYWPSYGGGLGRDDTFIGYSKAMIDKLHFDYGVADLPADDLSRSIGSMFVIDSLIAFEKARRDRTFMAWVGQDA